MKKLGMIVIYVMWWLVGLTMLCLSILMFLKLPNQLDITSKAQFLLGVVCGLIFSVGINITTGIISSTITNIARHLPFYNTSKSTQRRGNIRTNGYTRNL